MSALYYTATTDYLVASFPRNGTPGVGLCVARKADETAAAQGEGFERKQARWYGYDGWQVGRVFFGEREDGFLLRATGSIADHISFALPDAKRSIARLDLAVTVWFSQPDMMIAKEAHLTAGVSRETRRAPGRMKIRLEDGTGDGDTLYLGSRKSAVFGRVYDKGKASNEAFYLNSWRWELQISNKAADKVYDEIERETDRPATIAASVTGWFSHRGVCCPIADLGGATVSVRAPSERSDLAKQLQWLNRQVRPVINRLLKQGREADILQALGLVGSIGRADENQRPE